MARSAIIASLALHAGALSWMAVQCAMPAGGSDAAASLSVPNASLLEESALTPPGSTVPENRFSTAEFLPPTLPEPSAFVSIHPVVAPLASVAPAVIPLPVVALNAKTDPAGGASAFASGESTPRKRARVAVRSAGGGTGAGPANGCVPPQFRVRYTPPYPEEARAERLEGVVLLLVSVDAAGRVADAQIVSSSGHPLLDRAALDSVRSWRFEPARTHGSAVAARVEIPIRFQIRERETGSRRV